MYTYSTIYRNYGFNTESLDVRTTLFKDLLGSFVRVGCCIPVIDFYLVLHDFGSRKITLMD